MDSQLFLQELLPGIAGAGLTLGRLHVVLSGGLQAGQGLGPVARLGQVLLQGLDVF